MRESDRCAYANQAPSTVNLCIPVLLFLIVLQVVYISIYFSLPGPHTFTENETIAKYEIMDGAPVRGESIPIRVFLAGYDLTPTMRDINKKFSVKYFLNLVLMDEEDRRYFKQQVCLIIVF